MKKAAIWIFCLCFMGSMTVNAAEVSAISVSVGDANTEETTVEETITEETAAEETTVEDTTKEESTETVTDNVTVDIPDVVGMNYRDAEEALTGIPVEVIRQFVASDIIPEDEVISQSMTGAVQKGEARQLILSISQGTEGVKPQKMAGGMPQGLAAVLADQADIVIDGDFSDWADKPYSWEFGYDNSSAVWNGWFYVDGKVEQCEKGTFNNIVRHKISLYCDSENVYVYVSLAKAYKAGFSGEDFEFTIDGQKAAFQLMAQEVDNKTPGVYTVYVKDRNSYQLADGAVAKILVHEGGVNNEMEVKIPLQAMKEHNSNIDIENIGTIQFKTSHLMYRPITVSGADTMPFVWAFLALLIVPVSVYVIRQYYGKDKKVQN